MENELIKLILLKEKGTNIKLTVDTEVQAQCNELLKDKAGSICVMDIYTGELIAMFFPIFSIQIYFYME